MNTPRHTVRSLAAQRFSPEVLHAVAYAIGEQIEASKGDHVVGQAVRTGSINSSVHVDIADEVVGDTIFSIQCDIEITVQPPTIGDMGTFITVTEMREARRPVGAPAYENVVTRAGTHCVELPVVIDPAGRCFGSPRELIEHMDNVVTPLVADTVHEMWGQVRLAQTLRTHP